MRSIIVWICIAQCFTLSVGMLVTKGSQFVFTCPVEKQRPTLSSNLCKEQSTYNNYKCSDVGSMQFDCNGRKFDVTVINIEGTASPNSVDINGTTYLNPAIKLECNSISEIPDGYEFVMLSSVNTPPDQKEAPQNNGKKLIGTFKETRSNFGRFKCGLRRKGKTQLETYKAVEVNTNSYSAEHFTRATKSGQCSVVEPKDVERCRTGERCIIRCSFRLYPIELSQDKADDNDCPHQHLSTIPDENNNVLVVNPDGVSFNATFSEVSLDTRGQYCYTLTGQTRTGAKSQTVYFTVSVRDKWAALYPFVGIVIEVTVLCIIIFICEKRQTKKLEEQYSANQTGEENHRLVGKSDK